MEYVIKNRRGGSWEEEGREREREKKGERGGRDHVPIEGGARVGGSGRESLIGKDPPDCLKGRNSHGKKKGGEKVDGFERRRAWKTSRSRSQVAKASAKAKTDRMA
jgi:hypothetical protein